MNKTGVRLGDTPAVIAGTPEVIAGTPTVIAGTPTGPLLLQMRFRYLEDDWDFQRLFSQFV